MTTTVSHDTSVTARTLLGVMYVATRPCGKVTGLSWLSRAGEDSPPRTKQVSADVRHWVARGDSVSRVTRYVGDPELPWLTSCAACQDGKSPALCTPAAAAATLPDGVVADCQCRQCIVGRGDTEGGLPVTMTRMIVCSTCGNKRCPHANDHRHACTHSNEPGQPGSSY